jgi:hypothetical protein
MFYEMSRYLIATPHNKNVGQHNYCHKRKNKTDASTAISGVFQKNF